MVSKKSSPRPTDRSAELISRSLAHIDAHLDEWLDASTLCQRAAMSVHHFHRVFQAHVGCSVGSYVTWRRLQRACALLVSGREPVLDIALAVGFESAQSLAKAMRRELDTTPTAVRRGESAPWRNLMTPQHLSPGLHPTSDERLIPMDITRYSELPAGLQALTATARGMVNHQMTRAAQSAFGELVQAVMRAGLINRAASFISIVPDDANGPDDPHCRYVAGILFGYRMDQASGQCEQPELPLEGSLAWQSLTPGCYAVFTHRGSYSTLHRTWRTIYRDWLPSSGNTLRDAPPMELCVNDPKTTPEDELITEIWLPVNRP